MKLEQLEVALRSFRISICSYSCTVRHTAYSGDRGLMPPWESPGTSLVAQMVNNQSATRETLGSIPGSGRSLGEGDGNPLQYSCWGIPWMEELVGYSPWGRKELDMTK